MSQEDIGKQDILIDNLAQNVTTMTLLPNTFDDEESKRVPHNDIIASTNVEQELNETPSTQSTSDHSIIESDLQCGKMINEDEISLTKTKKEENNYILQDTKVIDQVQS